MQYKADFPSILGEVEALVSWTSSWQSSICQHHPWEAKESLSNTDGELWWSFAVQEGREEITSRGPPATPLVLRGDDYLTNNPINDTKITPFRNAVIF